MQKADDHRFVLEGLQQPRQVGEQADAGGLRNGADGNRGVLSFPCRFQPGQ
jgi:hypothetical protein